MINKLVLKLSVLLTIFAALHAMDRKTICVEQQLIDAILSPTSCEEICRKFFSKMYGLFTTEHNIDYQDPATGNSALMAAIIKNRPELVSAITANYNPTLTLTNKAGQTVFDLAHQSSNTTLTDLLTEYKKLITPSKILAFPHDIIKTIAQYVTGDPKDRCKDIASLASTCTHLHKAINNNPIYQPVEQQLTQHQKIINALGLATQNLSDNQRQNAFWDALYKRDFTLFCLLLELYPQYVNSRSMSGQTFLAYIVRTDIAQSTSGLELIKKLFNAAKSVNKRLEDGAPFRWKVYFKDVQEDGTSTEISEVQRDDNYSLNAVEMLLCQICHLDIGKQNAKVDNLVQCATYLLNNGFAINSHIPYSHHEYDEVENTNLKSILGIAVFNRSTAALKLLINRPHIDIHKKIGTQNLLTYAASWESAYPEIMKILLQDTRITINDIQEALNDAFDNPRSPLVKETQQLLLNHAKSLQSAQNPPHTPAWQPAPSGASNNPQNPLPTPALAPAVNPPVPTSLTFRAPFHYCVVALVACAAVICGYKYFYPSQNKEDDEETDAEEQEQNLQPVIA